MAQTYQSAVAIFTLLAFNFGPEGALHAGSIQPELKNGEPTRSRPAPTGVKSDALQNCINVANVATAARLAFQEKQLSELEQRLQRRMTELEGKRAEVQELWDRYDSFIKKTDDSLIGVYSKMKPDAAATQLANLDDDSAAALLMRLKPRESSAILSEMDPFHAAVLTKSIVTFSSMKRGAKKL